MARGATGAGKMNAPAIDEATKLSIVKDPFNAQSMVMLSIYCGKSLFGGAWSYNATVGFQNGDTKGEQKFKGDSLKSVLLKVETFVAELEAARK